MIEPLTHITYSLEPGLSPADTEDADSTLLRYANKYFQIIEFIDTLCLPYCEIFSLYHHSFPEHISNRKLS